MHIHLAHPPATDDLAYLRSQLNDIDLETIKDTRYAMLLPLTASGSSMA